MNRNGFEPLTMVIIVVIGLFLGSAVAIGYHYYKGNSDASITGNVINDNSNIQPTDNSVQTSENPTIDLTPKKICEPSCSKGFSCIEAFGKMRCIPLAVPSIPNGY